MEKRIRATRIEDVGARDTSSQNRMIPTYSSTQHPSTQFQDVQAEQKQHSLSTPGERSIAFWMGLLMCVIGVILTPIIIGIPIVFIGLWMVLFPNSFVSYSKKNKR